MRIILLLSICLCFIKHTFATELNLQNLYINPVSQTKPEAIILYNSQVPCPNCNKAINMIISVLKNNYKSKLRAYLIDENKHPEFKFYFKASGPLTLVIIRISDKASFSYAKLNGLQSQTEDKISFNLQITEFINNFLAWD